MTTLKKVGYHNTTRTVYSHENGAAVEPRVWTASLAAQSLPSSFYLSFFLFFFSRRCQQCAQQLGRIDAGHQLGGHYFSCEPKHQPHIQPSYHRGADEHRHEHGEHHGADEPAASGHNHGAREPGVGQHPHHSAHEHRSPGGHYYANVHEYNGATQHRNEANGEHAVPVPGPALLPALVEGLGFLFLFWLFKETRVRQIEVNLFSKWVSI